MVGGEEPLQNEKLALPLAIKTEPLTSKGEGVAELKSFRPSGGSINAYA